MQYVICFMPNSTSMYNMYNTNVYTEHMGRIESEGFEGQLMYKCDYHTINYSIYAFFVYIYRNSSARFFSAGAVSSYVSCSKILKKYFICVRYCSRSTGSSYRPFLDSYDFNKIEARFPGSVLTLGQYF